MRKWTGYAAALVLVCLHTAATVHAQDWVDTLRAARANYHDTDGNQITIARWGDSITWSAERFMVQLRDPGGTFQTTPETAAPMAWLNAGMRPDSWGWQWSDGNYSTQCWLHGDCPGVASTSAVAASTFSDAAPGQKNYQYWLQHDNPEIALIMFGTNDLSAYDVYRTDQYSPSTYKANLREMVQACLANGTLPILTTISPRDEYDSSAATAAGKALAHEYYQAVVDLAAELHVPMIDYYQAIVTRRPGDTWDGKATGDWYTLISPDGVHPSFGSWWDPAWWQATNTSFSETALSGNGNTLHSYLGLLASYDAYEAAIATDATRTWAVPAGAWLDANSWGNRAPASYHTARIGNGGVATISQPGATCLQLLIGVDSNELGTVNIVTGGSLRVGEIDVGGSATARGGAGTFTISGGNAAVDGRFVVWDGSAVHLGAGTLVDSDANHPYLDIDNKGTIYVEEGVYALGCVGGIGGAATGTVVVEGNATLWVKVLEQASLVIEPGGTVYLAGCEANYPDMNVHNDGTLYTGGGPMYFGTLDGDGNTFVGWDDAVFMSLARADYAEAIPEPGTLALLALGAMGLLRRRRPA